MSYLADLSMRLAAGAVSFSDEFRGRHAEYLAGGINSDGGYSGRQGGSDAYYTSFALRGLAMLGELDGELAGRVGAFLQSRNTAEMSSIDFFSWLLSVELLRLVAGVDVLAGSDLLSEVSQREQAVIAAIERYQRPDGGYAKSPKSAGSSIYHTFLALACRQLFQTAEDSLLKEEQANDTQRLVQSRRRDDGGFVEIRQMRQSGTNPTAAAVAILRIIGCLEDPANEDTRESAIVFLRAMQTPDGGFRANTRIPVSDLLSTFTALVALAGLSGKDEKKLADLVDLSAARRYAEGMEVPGGGFRGGVWDDSPDVEYTFYGLGALALLNTEGFSDNG